MLQESSEAVGRLEPKDEVSELLEELVLYIGRLNYWLEPVMPWPGPTIRLLKRPSSA